MAHAAAGTKIVMVISLKFTSSCSHSVRRVLWERAAFVLSDSKSKGEEKIGNVSLERCGQILEETRRTQDPVQFTCI